VNRPTKPGPQPMPKDQRMSLRMQVPINPPLYAAIHKAAKRRLLTVPAFVRMACLITSP